MGYSVRLRLLTILEKKVFRTLAISLSELKTYDLLLMLSLH